MKTNFFLLLCLLCLVSCKHNQQHEKILALLSEWKEKRINIPDSLYNICPNCNQTKTNSKYRIINYVDSAGCLSCNLRLREWNILMKNFKDQQIEVLPILIFNTADRTKIDEIRILAEKNHISFPIIIDSLDLINKLNKFPTNHHFQTFLINKDNKVLAIGNPILNPKIEELYLLLMGEKMESKKEEILKTNITIPTNTLSLKKFDWEQEQTATLNIKNTGKFPLIIQNITTSCGCITIDYPQTPIQVNQQADLQVTYKANEPGFFHKTINIYCNIEESPLQLTILGEAISNQ